ncbi:MAG: NAD(+) diphosphatase, partial [Geminicoccaceae bacterium]|nr:NAD(+) diphosphatase [Geminicoccaceae bacterium]
GLDRAAHHRRDPEWLAAAFADPSSAVVLLDGVRPLIEETEAGPRALIASSAALGPLPGGAVPLFLGLVGERPHFALDLGGRPLVEIGLDRGDYVELRSVGGALPRVEAGLLAFARAIAHWQLRHAHCGACGTLTRVAQGGHVRHCDACGLDVFPRTDPAVIVLVGHGNQCLLGRAPRFPEGMYSTLAGFVEPGESLEQCVQRELFEEVGIEVDGIRYLSSQPWPFPQSLMLGFRAEAKDTALRIDREELAEARWFGRDELRRGEIRLPSPDSIARYLVDGWLGEG